MTRHTHQDQRQDKEFKLLLLLLLLLVAEASHGNWRKPRREVTAARARFTVQSLSPNPATSSPWPWRELAGDLKEEGTQDRAAARFYFCVDLLALVHDKAALSLSDLASAIFVSLSKISMSD